MKSCLILTLVLLLLVACGGATKIAYVSTDDAIYIMNADGSNQTRVTTDKHLRSLPCWSSDNKRLTFLSERDSQIRLVIIDTDGSDETVINLNIIPEVSQKNFDTLQIMPGCWSSKSDKILVVVMLPYPTKSEGKIYEVTLKDSVAKLVISNGNTPAWSPNGDRLVFHREEVAQIAKAGDGKILTKNLAAGYCTSWSPDGEKLVCFEDEEDGSIFTINTDGTERTKIGLAPFDEGEQPLLPTWSPDGKKILFSTVNKDNECVTYTVNIDGSEQTRLLDRGDTCFGIYSIP